MSRIGAVGRIGSAQAGQVRAGREAAEAPVPAARALVVVEGGRSDGPGRARHPGPGPACAGFIAQLMVADDPALRPSRLVRTRQAAARYAETARRLA